VGGRDEEEEGVLGGIRRDFELGGILWYILEVLGMSYFVLNNKGSSPLGQEAVDVKYVGNLSFLNRIADICLSQSWSNNLRGILTHMARNLSSDGILNMSSPHRYG